MIYYIISKLKTWFCFFLILFIIGCGQNPFKSEDSLRNEIIVQNNLDSSSRSWNFYICQESDCDVNEDSPKNQDSGLYYIYDFIHSQYLYNSTSNEEVPPPFMWIEENLNPISKKHLEGWWEIDFAAFEHFNEKYSNSRGFFCFNEGYLYVFLFLNRDSIFQDFGINFIYDHYTYNIENFDLIIKLDDSTNYHEYISNPLKELSWSNMEVGETRNLKIGKYQNKIWIFNQLNSSDPTRNNFRIFRSNHTAFNFPYDACGIGSNYKH